MKVDFTIAEILEFGVNPHPDPNLAAAITCRAYDGSEITIGIGPKALETLSLALIENSPRTPGTPGRN